MTKPGGWETKAACKGHPNPSVFFPPEGSPAKAYAEARKVCNACRVRSECLEAALGRFEADGMWGGLTPVERWKLQEVAS